MTDPLDAFRRQGEIDAAKPLPVPIDWKARAEKAEQERDALREALIDLVNECEEYARINHLHNADGSPGTTGAMKHARAALEAKP